ncbi:protein disulfide oxidoreductase [Pasteurella sp. PK-2025]|uniref:protein disulfide oxidoreductase n=1 Tax=unclassified Pasteurella TaxID=2621516 RepID=UPI003C70AF8D
MAKIKKFLRHIITLSLSLLIVSVIMDVIRQPEMPEQANHLLLRDLQQRPFFLAQLNQTEPVILYFWGSWCGYCQYTSPTIQTLAQEGVKVVSVALRSGTDEQVQTYLDEHHYQFTTVNDEDGTISKQWQVQVTPTIIILDKGKMAFATTGLTSYWGLKVRLFLTRFF